MWLPARSRKSFKRYTSNLSLSKTGLVLAAFGGYGLAWYLGALEGNFALLLFLAVVVTGVYWVAEKLYFLPQRQRAAEQVAQDHARRQAELEKLGVKGDMAAADAAFADLLAVLHAAGARLGPEMVR